MQSPEKETAPRLASESGGIGNKLTTEFRPNLSECLAAHRLACRFGISMEVAFVVAELSGIGVVT